MIYSHPFGEFNPDNPSTIPGPLAKTIYVDAIEIEAPIELVWQIMTGFDLYPEWNPINRFFKLDNGAKVGETVTFGPCWGPYDLTGNTPLPKHDFVNRERLTIWEPNRCLAYADIKKYMAAERVQYLSTLDNGNTRYHTFERTSGWASPLLRLAYTKKIQRGFTANGEALKIRAEAMAAN